jgi:ligand-binding sensor domain-containing protein
LYYRFYTYSICIHRTWIGSEEGLIRYNGGEISVFTTANGLNSNKINDIAIRNTAIRYIATTAGINKMIGVGISSLNFDNTNAPPASAIQTGVGEVNLPIFVNAKAIR